MEHKDDTGARAAGERHEDLDRELAERDRLAEVAEHKHPARPQQPDAGYAEGVDQEPDTPAEELEPDFARGKRHGTDIEQEAELEEKGNFATGIERDPDEPVERRFSEGIERSPTSE